MTNTNPTLPAENRVLAEQVYDMIMQEIEPDLVLAVIPTLDATYANESDADHESRMQRYAVAYKKFDIQFEKFMTDVNGKVRMTHRQALREKEEQAKSEEINTLTSIASAFN